MLTTVFIFAIGTLFGFYFRTRGQNGQNPNESNQLENISEKYDLTKTVQSSIKQCEK
jgi:predicted negative regulator of RcsB-dependent stress response